LAETSFLSRATQYLTPGYCPVALNTIVPKPSATPISQRFPWGITVPPAITSSISVCLGFGSGEGTIDQAVPFQCNTRLVVFESSNWSVSPNAQTSFADTAITPRSWLEMVWVLGPPTLGLGTTVQLVPADADIAAVADAIVKVVDTPFGKRPFRVHIDPTQDGAEVVNMVSDRVRAELLRRIGLGDLLAPRDLTAELQTAA
jgi:hypothetical protein